MAAGQDQRPQAGGDTAKGQRSVVSRPIRSERTPHPTLPPMLTSRRRADRAASMGDTR